MFSANSRTARKYGRKSRKRRSRLVTLRRRKSNVGWRPKVPFMAIKKEGYSCSRTDS